MSERPERFPYSNLSAEQEARWRKVLDARETYPVPSERSIRLASEPFTQEERLALQAGYDTAFEILHDYTDQRRFLRDNLDAWSGTVTLFAEGESQEPISLYSWIDLGVMKNGDIAQWYKGNIDTTHRVFEHKGFKVSGTNPSVDCPPYEELVPELAGVLADATDSTVDVIQWNNRSTCFYWGVEGYCDDGPVDTVALPFKDITLGGDSGDNVFDLEVPIFSGNKLGDIRFKTSPRILGNLAEYDDPAQRGAFVNKLIDEAGEHHALWKQIVGYFGERPWMKELISPKQPLVSDSLRVGYTHLSYERWGGTETSYIEPGKYPGPPKHY